MTRAMLPADSPFAPLLPSGPHPATAELRAYAAGTLAPAEEHRIEAHTLNCERCADLVEGFSMTDGAATDQSIAALRTRLQARTGMAEPGAVPARRAWPRVAAAAALLGVVAGGIWGWERQGAGPPPATARLETTPAVAPAPTVTPAATPPSAPVAKANPAPATKEASYAALTPAPTRRPKAHRPIRPSSEATANDQLMAPEGEISTSSQTADAAVASEAATPDQPASGAAPAPTSAALTDNALDADTAAGPKKMVAAVKMRARILPPAMLAADKAATARVADTPMPAAPAINPAPVGGTPALRDYLRREATGFEPENAKPLTGTVRVQFTVGADGKVSNLKVVRGLRPDYDAEALRIVCEGPAWQPGIAGGRRAALPMEITVPF